MDHDNSAQKGYQHACRLLQQHIPDFTIADLGETQYELWSFGLRKYSIHFPRSVTCDLLKLHPEEIDNEANRPFWFMFEHPPTFKDPSLTLRADPDPKNLDEKFCRLEFGSSADLTYGALTEMSRFHAHKDYVFRMRKTWTVRVLDEFLETQSIDSVNTHSTRTKPNLVQTKRQITLDLIDRAVVFFLSNNGFTLFLNMKGNVHELNRPWAANVLSNHEIEFQRQGVGDKGARPLFPTIRLRIVLKDKKLLVDSLERNKTINPTTSEEEKSRLMKKASDESLKSIRELFRLLLSFFYRNRIQVCFGSVTTSSVFLARLDSLHYNTFPTFTQMYSWSMLLSISFRLQVQLHQSKDFVRLLRDYSKPRYEEKNDAEVDDRFYWLCLYLHRRLSEYIFLDLDQEIRIGIDEYDSKYKRFKEKHLAMQPFNKTSKGTAYIPSIILTPTVIFIRPLKLCRLNRVLREKRFGGCLNFALVELRDEAQRLLFPTAYRSLQAQIKTYLTEGFPITLGRQFKYLHHSQSQVKSKQFWFYHHDQENNHLSHSDAYVWMGNFDKERVVAKHAARIALCFTSTKATIQVRTIIIDVWSSSDWFRSPANIVTYVRDVKDPTGTYAFSDGVGTISSHLRDEVSQASSCSCAQSDGVLH